jgi:two-component sensor histidine kinase
MNDFTSHAKTTTLYPSGDPMAQVVTDEIRLQALERTGLLDTPPEEAFDRITRLARNLLAAPIALVSLVDRERQFFKSQQGLPSAVAAARQTPLSHSFCKFVVAHGQPVVIDDASQHELVKDNPALRDFGIAAYLGVPLRALSGHVLGALAVFDTMPRHWTDEDVRLLGDIAQIVMSEVNLRHEIEERKNAEKNQQLLIAELHHRVKNTLATVQALIQLSLNASDSMEGFRQSIGARIASLAHTHTLLIDRRWDSISFTELLWGELEPYNEGGRVLLEGPDFQLSAQLAVTLGMIFHELTTNATKHGALSAANGRLKVSWTADRTEQGRALDLNWQESGGPPATVPERRGFGSRLLERLLVRQFNGKVEFDFQPHGLRVAAKAVIPEGRHG